MVRPPHVCLDALTLDVDCQGPLVREHVPRLREEGKALARPSRQEDAPASSLSHSVVTGLEDAEGALVPHLNEGSQAQFQHHVVLEGCEVAHILQDEIPGTIEVAVL